MKIGDSSGVRLGVQKPLSDPFNVSLDQGIGLKGIKAAEFLSQGHLLKKAMDAPVAEPTQVYSLLQILPGIVFPEIGAAVHLYLNQMMKGQETH